MEWITAVRKSVKFIEEHLKDKISAQDVADQVYMSLLHFQKGFQVLTGYSVAEYIRNRKLYLAALDLKTNSAMTLQTMRFQNTGMKCLQFMVEKILWGLAVFRHLTALANYSAKKTA